MKLFLLFLFCLINISFAQTKISGKVTTKKGEALLPQTFFLKILMTESRQMQTVIIHLLLRKKEKEYLKQVL